MKVYCVFSMDYEEPSLVAIYKTLESANKEAKLMFDEEVLSREHFINKSNKSLINFDGTFTGRVGEYNFYVSIMDLND